MAERRMVSTGIYDSSVAWNLGEKNPGLKGLAAQRILEILIFLADDHGRGRYIPGMIRTRAFSSVQKVLTRISIEDVETWLRQVEEEGTIKTYEIDGQKYYTLTGWRHYQRGNWRPRASNIPPPPWETDEETAEDLVGSAPDKSTNKSTKKYAVEVDTEHVGEKKGREEKGENNTKTSLPDQTAQRPVKDIIADPNVSDSVAVSAACQDLPDEDDFLEKQARRMRTEDINEKPD